MKMKKRILSFVIVLVLVVNYTPFDHAPSAYAARGEKLILKGMISEAITDMPYGWDGTQYQFADDIFDNIEDGDEVHLMARVTTLDPIIPGSTVNIELSDFWLEGANASDYLLPDILEPIPVKKPIQITKRPIIIAPAYTSVYYGQDIPSSIPLDPSYTEQIINGDEVSVDAAFQVQNDGNAGVGDYPVYLGTLPVVSGAAWEYYDAIPDAMVKFSITAYQPTETASAEEEYDEEQEEQKEETKKIKDIVLKAPAGFQILESDDPTQSIEEVHDSITIPFNQEGDTSYTYYLRNIDPGSEYYKAISEAKTYIYAAGGNPGDIKPGDITPPVDDKQNKQLILKDGIFNAIGDVEYGWKGGTYRFPDNTLLGIDPGDEVYLVATVDTTGTLAVGSLAEGEFHSFQLAGADAAKYLPPVDVDGLSVHKPINITPKTIYIRPQYPKIYYGQYVPEQISTVEGYGDQIVDYDEASINATFKIQNASDINVREHEVILENPIINGRDKGNYRAELAPETKLIIYSYTPEETATLYVDPNQGPQDNSKIRLKAPDGFSISKENKKDSAWSGIIEFTTSEIHNGVCNYYLKNNNNGEYNQAISEVKTYVCSQVPTPIVPKVKQLSINQNYKDMITKVEYGWDGNSSYRFPKEVFKDSIGNDEVYLVADAFTPDPVEIGSSVNVKFSHFRLEGANAANYKLKNNQNMQAFERSLQVEKKTITIKPAHPYCYYGQTVPLDLSIFEDYSDQIVNNEDVCIKGSYKVENDGKTDIGFYPATFDGLPVLTGADREHYTVETPGVNFEVKKYDLSIPPATLGSVPDDDYGRPEEFTLCAPENFKIYWNNRLIDIFERTMTVSKEAMLQGSITYYLRNDDSNDTEFYNAISTEKLYQFDRIMKKPTVKHITIEKVDPDTILNFQPAGVLSNGKVKVTVKVEGTNFPQDTEIYFGEVGDFHAAKKEDIIKSREGDTYFYTTSFVLDVEEGSSIKKYLKAYAANSCGKGSIYPTNGTDDTFVDRSTKADQPLIIDKKAPEVGTIDINGNYRVWVDPHNWNKLKVPHWLAIWPVSCGSIQATFNASDPDSGIAKVECLWDDGFKLNWEDGEFHTEPVELSNPFSNEFYKITNNIVNQNLCLDSSYEVILPWPLSQKVTDDKHILNLKITDNVGNVYESGPKKDPVGSDMRAPQIESIEIRKPKSDESDSILSYFPFGTCYRNMVEVVIKANDNELVSNESEVNESEVNESEDSESEGSETSENYYNSGVSSVKINEMIAEKNDETNEYIMVVSPDSIVYGMNITVEDNVGNSTSAYAKEIPVRGMIDSNDLIIEDDAPTIDFGNILEQGHKDDQERVWFGTGNNDTKMTIKVADDHGDVKSGLYSVTIKDNDEVKYSNSDFSFGTNEHEETYVIGKLKDGEHKFTVEVKDNCGNTCSDEITFYKDTTPPDSGNISVNYPQGVLIGSKRWYNSDQVITFRVDSSDAASGLNKFTLNINGESVDYEHDQIKKDDAGYYVLIDTVGIPVDSQHEYTVKGEVTDFADNSLTLEPLTVYKDMAAPTVSKVTVEKKTDMVDKILNILTFGIYSNDTLIFKVYTYDMEYDSGVDYATVRYEGRSETKNLTSDGSDIFTFEIAASDIVFESNLDISVYDRYGKVSASSPNITNLAGGATSNGKYVMTETVLPILNLSLPASDGITRTDGQSWYNSNKVVELQVQDTDSGISNIDMSVNGIDIPKDKNNVDLLKQAVTASATARNNELQTYTFDTDYFTSIVGEAENGEYIISISVTDNAGNITKNETTYYMDKVIPVIDRINFAPKTYDDIDGTESFMEELEYGYYFKTDFNITVSVSDVTPSSGLYQVNYRLAPYNDGKKQEEVIGSASIIDGVASISVPSGFKGQVYVEAYDNVLNRSGERTAKAYIVDYAAPNIQITKNASTSNHDAVGNNLYTQTNSFTVVVTDTVSGIKQIGYEQSAEQNPYDRKVVDIENKIYSLKDDLGDGWSVTGVDVNLVTQVTKTFTFPSDDNDVILTFDATDNTQNRIDNVRSEKFTVDKTAPIINVVFNEDDDSDLYYNQNRVANITVIDRNFDPNLIRVMIENTFGSVPGYSFANNSKTEHSAVINFDEGDYTFDVTGTDLGDQAATVNFAGGNEKMFYVDKTKPAIEENFAEFTNDHNNCFNVEKTANISITEHNFDPELVNLRITRKDSGEEHNSEGLEDVTSMIVGGARWNSQGDVHTLSITFDSDAVYYLEMTPVDLATNITERHNTVIFEIDRTKPIVKMKNDSWVEENDTEFVDVYPYSRKNDTAPTIEFEDVNITQLNYVLTLYIPDYSTSDMVVIKPKVSTGSVDGNKFTLPNFTQDGVYAVELTAVDMAGNESEPNYNTYVRMVNQDVLAFIMDSNLEKKTGLFSFEYEDGEAISKKPSSFDDLEIYTMAQKDTPIDIVLRDGNGNEIVTNAKCTVKDRLYGVQTCTYELKSDFFKENFQDDTDAELHLTVKNQGRRIDLGKMHIDNIEPTCNIPSDLSSWHWFYGDEDRTIVLSDISELVDEECCKIYDNGKSIPFDYSSEAGTIKFTFSKGWHNIGIILDDMAGNSNNIQEKVNIHIGYFWIWVITAISITTLAVGTGLFIYYRKRKKRELEEM